MLKRGEKIVIALGGNSLIKKGEKPTISNQFKNAKKKMEYYGIFNSINKKRK